jgi:hypothetical protein
MSKKKGVQGKRRQVLQVLPWKEFRVHVEGRKSLKLTWVVELSVINSG